MSRVPQVGIQDCTSCRVAGPEPSSATITSKSWSSWLASDRNTASSASSRLNVATTTEMSSATLAPRKPGFHIAIVAAFGVGDSQQEPFGSVKKPGTKYISAKEREQSVANSRQERDAPPCCHNGVSARG